MLPQAYTNWVMVGSHDTVRPGTTWGATITPGNNTYGTYATVLGTALAADAYGIEIVIQGIGISATITDSLTTIGIDPAGGTTFTDLIPHLLCTGAGIMTTNAVHGIKYFFPIRIPAGATIGAKGSINNVTVGTQLVGVRLWTRPSNPKGIWKYGTQIVTFGEDTAGSAGAAVTAGTTSEGTYTQLGSAIANKAPFYWTVGTAIKNNAAWNNTAAHIDLAIGDATNKKQILQDQIWCGSSTELANATYGGNYGNGAIGDLVYARVQSSSASTGFGCIAYGVI